MHFVEFSYNNVYHAFLKTISFEALYGKKYNKSISWDNQIEIITIGPKLMKGMEDQMIKIKQNLKATKDRKVMQIIIELTNNLKLEIISF